jgi:hypothetical protein
LETAGTEDFSIFEEVFIQTVTPRGGLAMIGYWRLAFGKIATLAVLDDLHCALIRAIGVGDYRKRLRASSSSAKSNRS